LETEVLGDALFNGLTDFQQTEYYQKMSEIERKILSAAAFFQNGFLKNQKGEFILQIKHGIILFFQLLFVKVVDRIITTQNKLNVNETLLFP
jgi:hypothetical protein